ncbi:MAG: glutamine-hydrolyzing GMP synthase [Acidilobus sp.]
MPWAPSQEHDTVLVVSFGGQYAHMISRRVRDLGVYSEVVPYPWASEGLVRTRRPRAVILSGGPSSVYEPGAPTIGDWVLRLDVPVLGICYGHQLLAKLSGGVVERGRGEYGRTRVEVVQEDPLLDGLGREEDVWMSHADYVARVGEGWRVLAVSKGTGYVAAMARGDRLYGVQFHPEVRHTVNGMRLLSNFLFRVSGVRPTWKVEDLASRMIEEVRSAVPPGEKALVAVSGGVDSTTAAVIARRALGDRAVVVFVNHGLLREGEPEDVLAALRGLGLDPVYIDASGRFLEALRGVSDPEQKRLIVGRLFADAFRGVASSDPLIRWLVQGTTYPDVIESGGEPGADRIKSHHNVAGLPSELGLKVIEPLRYLYKDEVRRLALSLGVPESIALRHPFPGPGLAVRVIGEVTEEKLRVARRASRIVEEELRKAGLYDSVWQAFAVVGDDRWVGVKGDRRAFGYVVTVRVVESEDGMTADWARLPHELLQRIASRIASEVPEVVMVTYAVTTKPPATIEPV